MGIRGSLFRIVIYWEETVLIVVNSLYFQKAQRRMTTFGVDFYRHLQDSNTEEENIPHIISSCIDEIDTRGTIFV